MPSSLAPSYETQRIAAVRAYDILDTPAEKAFDRLTRLAARIFDAPIAFVALMDADRLWFKSCIGLDSGDVPRDATVCAHAILEDRPLVIEDLALDPRFAEAPFVVGGPRLRFYAGAQLRTADGHNLGTICIADTKPRTFDARSIQTLNDLAEIAIDELELRRAKISLEALATTDPLTGLGNKRAFADRLETLIAEGARGRRFALVMIDIDHFKRVNDRYGHATGDAVLKNVADALRRRTRKTDLVARFGGEELCVLLTDVDELTALVVAEELRRTIAALTEPVRVTASFGVAAYSAEIATGARLVEAADAALYRAKRGGRNRVLGAGAAEKRSAAGRPAPFWEAALADLRASSLHPEDAVGPATLRFGSAA